MKRRIFLALAILLMLAGIFILVRIAAGALAPTGKGALQVTTNVQATVFLDNRQIGRIQDTALCLCNPDQTISAGIHELKITPDDKSLSPYTVKVDINTGVLTAVERTFLPRSLSSTYILTLEKTASRDPQLFIASIPDGALVSIDGESKGITPYTLDSLSASEHEVQIEKSGFAKKTIRVRAVESYKLVLNVVLGAEGGEEPQTTVQPSPSTTIEPTQAAQEKTTQAKSVKILDTPNGFLRVRAGPSTTNSEVGRVSDGDILDYVDENASWLKIKTEDGIEGWVSKSFAEVVSE